MGLVLVSGEWRPVREAYALLDVLVEARTYKRDKDGQFSSGGGGGTPADLHGDAAIHATFDFEDPVTGLTAKVSSIRGGDPQRSTYVDIVVTDRDGNTVGGGTRTIHHADSESVAHSGFMLSQGIQGQGFMTRYNQQVEDAYRDHGMKRIEIHASAGGKMVGGYAWARAGYDFSGDSRATTAALVTGIHTHSSSTSGYSAEVRDAIKKVAANPRATPLDYAMIGHTPGATTWPGKEIMLQTSWDGVKTL